MSKKERSWLEIFAMTAVSVVGQVFAAYTLTLLWRWFIVPGFGAPPLRIPVAVGISLIVGMLAYNTVQADDSKPDRAWLVIVAKGYLIPAIALGVGWLWSLAM